jgi:hypothetical protein
MCFIGGLFPPEESVSKKSVWPLFPSLQKGKQGLLDTPLGCPIQGAPSWALAPLVEE